MSQNTEIQPLLPAAPIPQPASWLGFKLINQAAANELGAAVLPSANSLAGNVLCALTDADGDALYVAGMVVAVTFTASAVRYSVAFPVAPQPRAGMTMYAVVDNIESGNLLADLPEGETVFDSVLTEDAAALIPSVKLVLDGVNPLQRAALEGQLVERRDALAGLVETDPLAALSVAVEVLSLASQVLNAEPAQAAELDPTEAHGYAQVLQDETLAVKWQDRLDSFFQGRIVAVRNALRELGWGGIRDGSGNLAKGGTHAAFEFKQVGAGRNVVGMTINGIRDDLTLNVDELAAAIDAAALPEPIAPAIPSVDAVADAELGQDAAKLADKRVMILDLLENNPGHKNAEALRAEVERINGIIGAPEAAEQAKRPAIERRIADTGAPAYMQAVHDLVYKWKTTTADQRLNAAFMGQMKRDVRALAKKIPETDEKAVAYIDLLINGIFGDDYTKPGVARVEFASGVIPGPTPEPTIEKASMEQLIKIAADTLAQLRRIDVYRVLNSAGDQRAELATFIAANRPDLVREVTDVMAEEWPVLGWALATAADGGNTEHGHNPARAADLAFLNSVISKSVDMWDDALADKIEAMGAAYEGDAEVESLWGDAIKAYTDFMVEAMG